MPMHPFRSVFPRIAQDECRTLTPSGHGELADHTFLLDEFYCSEPGCDCRRVVLNVIDTNERRHVATLNYGFDPPEPPGDEDGQLFLDPLNPQSASSAALLELTGKMIEFDAAYRARLRRHYRMWKRAVDDRTHPQHERIRDLQRSADAMGRREPQRREQPKVPRNAPCPCGSGRKYKHCCARQQRA